MTKKPLTPALRKALLAVSETGVCGNVGHVRCRLEDMRLIEENEVRHGEGFSIVVSHKLTACGRLMARALRAEA